MQDGPRRNRREAQARTLRERAGTEHLVQNSQLPYSQMVGREELFERERGSEPVAGWHSCELACARLEA